MGIDAQDRTVSLQARIEELTEELRKVKEFDSLTGLYNRSVFYEKVRGRIDISPAGEHVIVCLDIEHFKSINDMYGSAEGDRILRYVAELFGNLASKLDGLAARLSVDVFALYLPITLLDVMSIENEVLDWFASYPLAFEIVPAIGVNIIEDTSVPVSVMCDRAILAANSVKGNYLKHIAEYHNDLHDEAILELETISGAEKALKERQFKVYLQPKCNIDTGKIIGAEALVRWEHPEKGLISPKMFIPIFEKSGFIIRLDAYVWEEVCALLRRWIDSGMRPIPISVNVSRRDLLVPNLCERFVRLIEKYDIPKQLLELEITESAYTENVEQIISVVNSLREQGFVILMDDFGSGYSSLNLLKDIDVDILKIDLRFLDDFNSKNKKGNSILESIVHMSKWLNMQVIAEGVETQEQVDFLLGIGCYFVQGYYFYKPMPVPELEHILLSDNQIVDRDYYSSDVRWREFTYEDLLQSGTMSHFLLNNILGGIALYERYQGEVTIQRVNAAYYSLTSSSVDDLKADGRHLLNLIYPDDRPVFLDALDRAHENADDGVEIQIRRYTPDDELVWLYLRIFFLAEKTGRELYYASIHDITQLRKSEDALRISEERFRLALAASQNALFDYDISTHVVTELTRYFGEGYEGPVVFENAPDCFIEQDMVYKEDIPKFLGMYQAINDGAPTASCLARLRNSDNEFIWEKISLHRYGGLRAGLRKGPKAFGLVEVITNLRLLESHLIQDGKRFIDLPEKEQQIGLRLMHETVPCGMIGSYCEDGFPLYFINLEMVNLLGYDSYEDFVSTSGLMIRNTIHPDDCQLVLEVFRDGFYEGFEYSVKFRSLRKDGSNFWTLNKGRIVRTSDGRLAIISVSLDISERGELKDS